MIIVLRLGHRKERDKRLSTHVGLTARAFGADLVVFSGEKDSSLISSIEKVVRNWGGSFKAVHVKNWKKFISDKKKEGFRVVHLTMYGEKFSKFKKTEEDFLFVVGGPKVPGEVYGLADLNLSVGNQPHSEVAALALALDRLIDWKNKKFPGARMAVEPCSKGKKIVKK